jgi:hypothetical protein
MAICNKGHSRGYDMLSRTRAHDLSAVSRSAAGPRCVQAPWRLRGHALNHLSWLSTLSLSTPRCGSSQVKRATRHPGEFPHARHFGLTPTIDRLPCAPDWPAAASAICPLLPSPAVPQSCLLEHTFPQAEGFIGAFRLMNLES